MGCWELRPYNNLFIIVYVFGPFLCYFLSAWDFLMKSFYFFVWFFLQRSEWLCRFHGVFVEIFQLISAWIVVGFTVERCIAIWYPILLRTSKKYRSKAVIVSCSIVFTLFSLSKLFLVGKLFNGYVHQFLQSLFLIEMHEFFFKQALRRIAYLDTRHAPRSDLCGKEWRTFELPFRLGYPQYLSSFSTASCFGNYVESIQIVNAWQVCSFSSV